MQVPYKFVTTVQLAITVRNAAYNAGRIGLDCEGCRLSRTGKLCLVQVTMLMVSQHCVPCSPVL